MFSFPRVLVLNCQRHLRGSRQRFVLVPPSALSAVLSLSRPSSPAPRAPPSHLCSARRAFSANSPPPPPTEVVLLVKKDGDADYAVLTVKPNTLVGVLKEKIVQKLGLTHLRLSTLTLHEARDELGADPGVALKSDAPLALALALTPANTPASAVRRVVVKGTRDLLGAVGTGSDSALVHNMTVSFPALPPPLSFKPVILGGESLFEAAVPDAVGGGVTHPFYLTPEQHTALVHFIGATPSSRPQLLMPVGTIKTGKTKLVCGVLPGMISAAHASASMPKRRRPVIFTFSFLNGLDHEAAIWTLSTALVAFGRTINVPFEKERDSKSALFQLPIALGRFGEAIRMRGGELWLVLDELQAPILASTPAAAAAFAQILKEVIRICSSTTRIVATGSGMVSLLNAIRLNHVNGFSLWDAVSFVSLGQSPPDAAARAMGARILASHSAQWPPPAQAAITLDRILKSLSATRALRGSGGGWMSSRPALLAYMVSVMGDARGDPESVFADAEAALFWKLVMESTHDTAAALASLRHSERVLLRSIASGGFTFERLRKEHASSNRYLVKIIELLAEPMARGPIIYLQPPYSALFQSWITSSTGELAVAMDNGRLELPFEVRENLIFLADKRKHIPYFLQNSVAEAVFHVLAANRIGFRERNNTTRPPRDRTEFDLDPALKALAESLSGAPVSTLNETLNQRYRESSTDGGRSFRRVVGFQVLLGLRHFQCHALGSSQRLLQGGLSAAIVVDCVRSACRILTQQPKAPFVMNAAGLMEMPHV